jgi:hypothetical protein
MLVSMATRSLLIPQRALELHGVGMQGRLAQQIGEIGARLATRMLHRPLQDSIPLAFGGALGYDVYHTCDALTQR